MTRPLLICALLLLGGPALGDQASPPLLLATPYHPALELDEYLVSEKYDGVRAYWNGSALLTRRGNRIAAPPWFTAPLPADTPLDGELWMGRSRFDEVSAAIRRRQPRDVGWRQVRYMLFDLPALDASFRQRAQRLQQLVEDIAAVHVQAVEQRSIANRDQLAAWLEQVIEAGGEGLMLHRADSRYRAGRSADLVKLKPYADAEATVLEHLPGKGRLKGMMGSLLVQTADGRRFRLGSGFSDEQRRNPPAIGASVTYRYRGLTSGGLPRFPTFVRERLDF